MARSAKQILIAVEKGEPITKRELERLEWHVKKWRIYVNLFDDLCQTNNPDKAIFLPCEGEAHKNAFIDHCVLCMPRWGEIPNPKIVKG
jgi:hypothetical protein